jgi:hypothetical protein
MVLVVVEKIGGWHEKGACSDYDERSPRVRFLQCESLELRLWSVQQLASRARGRARSHPVRSVQKVLERAKKNVKQWMGVMVELALSIVGEWVGGWVVMVESVGYGSGKVVKIGCMEEENKIAFVFSRPLTDLTDLTDLSELA